MAIFKEKTTTPWPPLLSILVAAVYILRATRAVYIRYSPIVQYIIFVVAIHILDHDSVLWFLWTKQELWHCRPVNGGHANTKLHLHRHYRYPTTHISVPSFPDIAASVLTRNISAVIIYIGESVRERYFSIRTTENQRSDQ